MNPARRKKRKKTESPIPGSSPGLHLDGPALLQKQLRREEWLILLLLLAFGTYHSILYFEHRPVPSSDFPAFVSTANSLLHFKLPPSFKRLPMLGLLQIGLSKFCWGPHPVLTAGWLLNAILHALTVPLFYLVGKHLLGKNAFFFALLAGVNPFILYELPDPIAETALIFFPLAAFVLLYRRSWWAYFFAMMASMIRYEFSILIAIVFFVDIFLRKTKKAKILVLVSAFGASLPFALWLLGTYLTWKPGTPHYIGHFMHKDRTGFEYWSMLWRNTFGSLLRLPAQARLIFSQTPVTETEKLSITQTVQMLTLVIRIITGAGFVFALVFSVLKKNWKFFALFAFWLVYVFTHSIRQATLSRYTVPIIWPTLLIGFYGLQSIWQFVSEKWRIPPGVIIGLQFLTILFALLWLIPLAALLPNSVQFSAVSASLVYVSMAVLVFFLFIRHWILKTKHLLRSITCLSVFCLFLISNQLDVSTALRYGAKDVEFKMLAEWYLKNAQPGERMLTTMPHVVSLFAPKYRSSFLYTNTIQGDSPQEMIADCYAKNITYIAWDSRLGLAVNTSYYKGYHLERIAFMGPRGRTREGIWVPAFEKNGPLEHVKTIQNKYMPNRFIFVYKLHAPPTTPSPAAENPPDS